MISAINSSLDLLLNSTKFTVVVVVVVVAVVIFGAANVLEAVNKGDCEEEPSWAEFRFSFPGNRTGSSFRCVKIGEETNEEYKENFFYI